MGLEAGALGEVGQSNGRQNEAKTVNYGTCCKSLSGEHGIMQYWILQCPRQREGVSKRECRAGAANAP